MNVNLATHCATAARFAETSCRGFCSRCGRHHTLAAGNARKACFKLMGDLLKHACLDFNSAPEQRRAHFSTAQLFQPAGGQMFGILECTDVSGDTVFLKAFSGQYNGIWQVPGWAPPLPDVDAFNALVRDGDPKIKALDARIEKTAPGRNRETARQQRKQLSQYLTRKIHALYAIRNFRGDTLSLDAFFQKEPPTGAGDCCAPKLLNHAVRRRLKPLSLAEFYWGAPNRSGTRRHGRFYQACREKCAPLLGHMLCGAETRYDNATN